MMRHAVPTAFAFEGEFFAALADFVKARKGTGRALPSDYIFYAMTVIVSNAYHASRIMFDNKWTAEKALKKLEATGILAQFIRCATVPQSHNLAGPGLFKMLDELQECIPFISKKLQRGQPCGDVIMAILQGKDGSRVEHSALLNKLRTVMRFVSCGDRGPESDQIRLCRNCGKSDISEAFQKSLMKCSRCQQAYYCSKECQRANWKIHKKTGTPATKKEVVRCENVQQTLSTFLHRQYVHIMVKMVNTCEQTGHSKSDLLVDLDFKANENGIVPAMQANPEFKIVPTKDYIEGSRPAEPAWLREGYDRKTYEGNVKDFLSMLKESFVKQSPSQMLCLTSYEGGYSIENFSMIDPTTNREMCSEEAVLAFKAYMTNGNDGPLSEIFGPQKLHSIKRELGIHYDYGFDEDLIQDAFIRMLQERQG